MAFDLKPSIAVQIHGNNYEHVDFEKKIKTKMPKTKVIIPEKNNVIVINIPGV